MRGYKQSVREDNLSTGGIALWTYSPQTPAHLVCQSAVSHCSTYGTDVIQILHLPNYFVYLLHVRCPVYIPNVKRPSVA